MVHFRLTSFSLMERRNDTKANDFHVIMQLSALLPNHIAWLSSGYLI